MTSSGRFVRAFSNVPFAMAVAADLWLRLSPLLDVLLSMPPDARAERLAAETDPDVRAAALSLLNALDRTGDDFLDDEGGVLAEAERLLAAPLSTVPDSLGPYRIVRQLGRGGMGVVYLAARNDGAFEQQVAIKLLPFADPARAERFARERRILARLDHPAIARLRDGGHTPDGQPYFVLDFVDGVPLLDHVRTRPEAERLRLFADVCDAVAYAHRNLVVHRDLKPSNLLVASGGQVKLLDFGIAKLLTDDDVLTRDASPFTPAYAAPEQRTGAPVTTATDVYALGLLLYELVSGHRFADRTDDPPPLPPDLWAIVAHATAPAPGDRYATPDALRQDVRRYLAGEPLSVRPPTLAYRAQRFVQRHRAATALTAVLLAGLTGAVGTALVQGQRARAALTDAEAARERAEATSTVLFSLLEGANPAISGGDTLTAQQLLERSLLAQPSLARYPDLRARLLALAGTTLRRTGAYGRADSLLGAAARLSPDPTSDLSRSVETERAQLAADRSDFSDAEVRYRDVLARTVARYGAGSLDASFPMADLGGVLADRNRLVEAESLLTRALVLRRRHLPPHDPRFVTVLVTFGTFLSEQRRYSEAEPLLREAVEIAGASGSPDATPLASALHSLGQLLASTSRYPDAFAVLERSLALRRRLYGPNHYETANALLALGVAQSNAQGNSPTAATSARCLSTLREGLRSARASVGEQHLLTASLHNAIGFEHRRLQHYDEAIPEYTAALRIHERVMGHTHPRTVSALHNIARAHMAAGAYDDALPLLYDARRRADRAYSRPDPTQAGIYNSIGTTLYRLGRKAEALAPYRSSYDLYARVYGAEHSQAVTARYTVGLTLLEAGNASEAAALLGPYPLSKTGALAWLHPLWQRTYGESLHLSGRSADARVPLEEAYAVFADGGNTQRSNARGTARTLADVYTRLGLSSEASLWASRAE